MTLINVRIAVIATDVLLKKENYNLYFISSYSGSCCRIAVKYRSVGSLVIGSCSFDDVNVLSCAI
jgi:ethanolamine utilization microcompartment shell protein EutS